MACNDVCRQRGVHRCASTVLAKTPVRVAVVPVDAIDESALPELAASHRREQ